MATEDPRLPVAPPDADPQAPSAPEKSREQDAARQRIAGRRKQQAAARRNRRGRGSGSTAERG